MTNTQTLKLQRCAAATYRLVNKVERMRNTEQELAPHNLELTLAMGSLEQAAAHLESVIATNYTGGQS